MEVVPVTIPADCWFPLGGRGRCPSRSHDSSPSLGLLDGGVAITGWQSRPQGSQGKVQKTEMSNWILWSQEEVAPGGSCLRDERWVGHSVPTRTCGGLSEHFAVKEGSQESVGWSLKRLLTS